ncbi:Heparanase-like protein [Melia azedarach]|uniref:Heparanase-like protein n=1 Tax=Melia azedarach TaxID=155640 RepID=A0ACC1XQH4_MELAZ|nr:Heparanase-like protein [Melia azedarach]
MMKILVCATLDWWPHDKCDYNQCPWGNSSALNLDLSHPLLAKAIQAFKRLRIRVGGSLQDQVLYDVGNLKAPCHPFRKMKDRLFGFSKGCLHMERWDELNQLFNRTGAVVTFGLNALHGRHRIKDKAMGGDWDSGNAYDLIKYTLSRGHQIDSWEFGNELSGKGIGASVNADLYGKDVITLKNIIDNLYKDSPSKPTVIAPGGFFEKEWYAKFLQVSGSNVVNVVTHHIYNLGAGVDPNLVRKILDPHHLNKVSETFSNLKQTIEKNGPWSVCMGWRIRWCLQQRWSSCFEHICEQLLVLRSTWNGIQVFYLLLPDASPFLRSYAHCSKGRGGITVLLINLSNDTAYIISVQNIKNMKLLVKGKDLNRESSFTRGLKRTVAWVGGKASDEHLTREEYHLTPKDGYLQSQTMVLNGIPVVLTEDKSIPRLDPVHVNVNSPIYIAPLSIAFIVFPNFDAPACA